MRLIYLALLPAALVACEKHTDLEGTMPAPEATVTEDAAADDTPAPEPVNSRAIDGVWTTGEDSGNAMVMYAPEDGPSVFEVVCREQGEDGAQNVLTLRRAATQNEAGDTLDVFTSAGSGAIGASFLEGDNPMVGGNIDPNGSLGTALANGTGEIRVKTGTSEYTFETSPELKALVDSCRPEIVVEAPAAEPAEGEEETPEE